MTYDALILHVFDFVPQRWGFLQHDNNNNSSSKRAFIAKWKREFCCLATTSKHVFIICNVQEDALIGMPMHGWMNEDEDESKYSL